jgi:hypothetical protein
VTVWKRRDLAVGREDWRRVGYPPTAAHFHTIQDGPPSTLSRSSLSSPLGTGGRSGLPLADIDRFRSPVARVAIDINAELFVSPEVER